MKGGSSISQPVYAGGHPPCFSTLTPHPKHSSHPKFITLVLPKAMARLPGLEGALNLSSQEEKRCIWNGKVSTQDIVKREDFRELQRKEFETKKTMCLSYLEAECF